MAIVVKKAMLRISKRALKTRISIFIAVLGFVAIYVLHLPFPLIILAAAIAGWLIGRVSPEALGVSSTTDVYEIVEPVRCGHLVRIVLVWGAIWLASIAALFLILGPDSVFAQEGAFFAKLAIVTFGGAYAVLAYMAQAAVEIHGWLAAGEMVDGLGLARTTPGPADHRDPVCRLPGRLAVPRIPGPDRGRMPWRVDDTMGHLHAVVSVDLRRRVLYGAASVEPGIVNCIGRDYRRHGRGHRQSDPVVRHPGPVQRHNPGRRGSTFRPCRASILMHWCRPL